MKDLDALIQIPFMNAGLVLGLVVSILGRVYIKHI